MKYVHYVGTTIICIDQVSLILEFRKNSLLFITIELT